MTNIIKRQWFLICLVLLFVAVILDRSNLLAGLGTALKDNHGSEVMIFLIFVFSGLVIEGHQIRAGIRDVRATILALVLIFVAAPLIALALLALPLETGVALGLFIVAVMPTTLSSGIVMTGVAGGNMAHALFVTIISNFVSIVSIPFVLSLLLPLLGQEKSLAIDQGAICLKLVLLVLLPLTVGMTLKAKVFAKRNMGRFQLVNQWMILGIVFISLGGAKEAILGHGISFWAIVLLVTLFHTMMLGASFVLVKLGKLEKGRYESVVFMGCQKTLALSVMLQVTYFSQFGGALLVCVIHHIVHLMIDGYLSTRLSR